MKKNDVIIFIMSAGPNASMDNLFETLNSISQNIGKVKYKYYIAVDNLAMKTCITQLFALAHKRDDIFLKKEDLEEVKYTEDPWSICYNNFFDEYKHQTEYILYSHDDLIVKTSDFFTKAIDSIGEEIDKVGWISFTNDRYYLYDKVANSNSFKNPFALDRSNAPRVYECHKYKRGERADVDKLDYPKGPVKACGPFTHFNLVKVSAMERIGPCVDWTAYTMLTDDDWNLEALRKGLWNVWVPDIFYTHPNPKYSHLRKPGTDLRFQQVAHRRFAEKWGFSLCNINDTTINYIRTVYKDTNLPHFTYKNTFEWDYLNKQNK